MEAAWIIVLFLALLATARWARDELRRPGCKALVFLSVQSDEGEERQSLPEKTVRLRKPLLLQTPPVPGMELDGHGMKPIKVVRSVLDESDKHHQVHLYFEPIRMPHAEVEPYARELAANFGWEILW